MKMRMKKIGTWRTERAGADSGVYLEAVDVPRDEARYIAASWSMLPEKISAALSRGAEVEIEIDPEELCLRVDQTL